MKRLVWENKSNNQLCVTIPKDLGIKSGDIVNIDKEKVRKVVYSTIASDFFRYGHLQFLEKAKELGDYHICGVLSDKAILEHRKKPLTTLKERSAIISNLSCVDMVMAQRSLDPSDNLKKIYEQFGDIELILVHGDNWKEIPGQEFLVGKKGKTVKLPYYGRLSDFSILKQLFSEYKTKFESLNEFSDFFQIHNGPDFLGQSNKHQLISTKAETLRSLRKILTKSKIEKPFFFKISDWKKNEFRILEQIQKIFPKEFLVVRSSAKKEDSLKESLAGKYHSVLNVEASNKNSIKKAIDEVIFSYGNSGDNDESNQVLIQKQIKDVEFSGVVLTRDMSTGSPYYIINYDDSGSTQSVTGGLAGKTVKISHFYASKESLGKWEKLIESIHELEKVIPGFPLDIEFAITKSKEVIFFQVRPLTSRIIYNDEKKDYVVKKFLNLVKEKYLKYCNKKKRIFSDMSFWNPAEIIGDSPNFLDYSLYNTLIMNGMWQKPLIENGYSKVSPEIMYMFGNKPYIDVTASFEFLIPSKIPEDIRKKMLEFHMKKLKRNPELHDKIEFEIANSYYSLNFNEEEFIENGFDKKEISVIKKETLELTNTLINEYEKYMLDAKKNAKILRENNLKILESKSSKISKIKNLLEDCKFLGIFHFARIARFAFIGKALLLDLVKKGIIDKEFYDNFLKSLNSPARDLKLDLVLLNQNQINLDQFLNKYGHLRPGTYDIISPSYKTFPRDFFENKTQRKTNEEKINWTIPKEILNITDNILTKKGIKSNAKDLFLFIKTSIEEREYLKFEFTKNISDVLEIIAQLGEERDLSREEMSKLSINEIINNFENLDDQKVIKKVRGLIKDRKKLHNEYRRLILPPIIFSEKDFDIINLEKIKPNFITQKKISGNYVILTKNALSEPSDLNGKIVVIENADPGFDWVLSQNILGLITRYGGVASHMAIRCSEFGIPAVIGCGENLFSKIQDSKIVEIDCKKEKMEAF